MELVIGGVYEIVSAMGLKYVVRVTNENSIKYDVVVLQNGDMKQEYSGHLMKEGGLLKNGTVTRLDEQVPFSVEDKPTFSIHPKKRLTKQEMEIESLLKHVQSMVTKEHLMRAIDEALDAGNRNLFMVLTNQLNELEGVTA